MNNGKKSVSIRTVTQNQDDYNIYPSSSNFTAQEHKDGIPFSIVVSEDGEKLLQV